MLIATRSLLDPRSLTPQIGREGTGAHHRFRLFRLRFDSISLCPALLLWLHRQLWHLHHSADCPDQASHGAADPQELRIDEANAEAPATDGTAKGKA